LVAWMTSYVDAVRELLAPDDAGGIAAWRRALIARPLEHPLASIVALGVSGGLGLVIAIGVLLIATRMALSGPTDYRSRRALPLLAMLETMVGTLVATALFIAVFRLLSALLYYLRPRAGAE
jgi:hypothetical protein